MTTDLTVLHFYFKKTVGLSLNKNMRVIWDTFVKKWHMNSILFFVAMVSHDNLNICETSYLEISKIKISFFVPACHIFKLMAHMSLLLVPYFPPWRVIWDKCKKQVTPIIYVGLCDVDISFFSIYTK